MEKILFLAHTNEGGELSKHALEVLACAKALGAELKCDLTAALFGESVDAAAASIGGCDASAFLSVSGARFAQARYATDAAAIEALARAAGATIVLAPATSRIMRAIGGAAYRLGGRVETHATSVRAGEAGVTISRWYYRQRMEAELSRTQRPWFITVEQGSAAPWQGGGKPAALKTVAADVPESAVRTSVVGFQAPAADEQTIRPDADILFVAGAGWTKKQPDGNTHLGRATELILGFTRTAQASLGSSKSLVDLQGEGEAVLPFLTHLNQIGQTGATPRHPKGLATCCHGEEPHVVGWRFITERRAINLNPNCGWAQGKADVLYVADAFAVMEKVNELLKQ